MIEGILSHWLGGVKGSLFIPGSIIRGGGPRWRNRQGKPEATASTWHALALYANFTLLQFSFPVPKLNGHAAIQDDKYFARTNSEAISVFNEEDCFA